MWESLAAHVPFICSRSIEASHFVQKYNVGWILDEPLTSKNLAEKLNALTEDEINSKRNKYSIF